MTWLLLAPPAFAAALLADVRLHRWRARRQQRAAVAWAVRHTGRP